MTYDAEKLVLGREPIQVVEMDLGYCSLTYGVSPCTASGVAGSECYNTRQTCQDPANYTNTTQTYRFCQPRDNIPIGINMIPSLIGDVSRAPTSITGGKGLGNRATVKIKLHDHTWSDLDIDKYVSTRLYNPETTGTYWGKFLARNPYFEGRELRVISGYITDPWDWNNFQTETYIIESINGPTNGQIEIIGKDILSKTYGGKAQYPVASTGVLSADITAAATSATLSPTGVGNSEYPASGYVSIGSEAMAFTRSGDILTLTRAQYGTDAQDHNANDTVQLCVSWSDSNVVDVLEELLVTGAGISSSYIPYGGGTGQWDIEKGLWLSASLVNGILMKPESIDKVIAELSESFMFDIWWDNINQKIYIKALSPEPGGVTVPTLTDDYELIEDSISVKRDSSQRVSEVRVFYNKVDYSLDNKTDNFAGLYISADINAEGSTRYGRKSIRQIVSRWINNQAQAQLLAGRTLARFVDFPSIISFEIDKKDDGNVLLANRVEIDTKYIQDYTGANSPTKFQVTQLKETQNGSKIRVDGISSSFSGRYWFIAPDGTPDYSSASEAQKAAYGFICYDTGVFLDGESAYKII